MQRGRLTQMDGQTSLGTNFNGRTLDYIGLLAQQQLQEQQQFDQDEQQKRMLYGHGSLGSIGAGTIGNSSAFSGGAAAARGIPEGFIPGIFGNNPLSGIFSESI